jgi:hypothetical protein
MDSRRDVTLASSESGTHRLPLLSSVDSRYDLEAPLPGRASLDKPASHYSFLGPFESFASASRCSLITAYAAGTRGFRICIVCCFHISRQRVVCVLAHGCRLVSRLANISDVFRPIVVTMSPTGVCLVSLFVLVCTFTAYSYGTSIALAIWLGTCLPCGAICTFCGAWCYRSNRDEFDEEFSAGKMSLFCGSFACVALLIGLVGACAWLAPWYLISQNPALFNVDALAVEWIGNRTAPSAGLFFVSHFAEICCVFKALSIFLYTHVLQVAITLLLLHL